MGPLYGLAQLGKQAEICLMFWASRVDMEKF